MANKKPDPKKKTPVDKKLAKSDKMRRVTKDASVGAGDQNVETMAPKAKAGPPPGMPTSGSGDVNPPGTVEPQPSMARQILDKLRGQSPAARVPGTQAPFDMEGSGGGGDTMPPMPQARSGPPSGMPTSGNGDMNVQDMSPKVGGMGAAMRLAAGPLGAALVSHMIASKLTGVDNPIKYYTDLLSSWDSQDNAEAAHAGVVRDMNALGPVGTRPIQPMPNSTPNLADERAQLGAKVGAPLPTSAKDVRSKAKASSVRETGGALSDQEIMDWNRKNNKNYKD